VTFRPEYAACSLLDVTESSGPGESSTRWRPVLLAGMQATMLLGAATLGVFKPGRARQPLARPPERADN
jgi:hypothetical protein